MRLRVLGPLTLAEEPARLAPRDRTVLAVLAVTPGENVRPEQIADALWGDAPPATWAKVVQGSVVRIRKALGSEAVRTSRYGYALVLPDDEIDASEFERLVRRGRELLALRAPEQARYALGQALDLWRGPALAELAEWPPARAAGERWEEMRREAQELYLEATLASGAPREALVEAGRLVEEAPLREARWSLLARAQYQAGRQGDALATLRRAKAALVGELGLDPGPDLEALEQAILRQDPAVLPEPATATAYVCPYRGLVHYDIGDAEHYFGRETEVERGRETLSRHHIVAVVGPSGCGKSSLARAGIGAALQASGRTVAVLTPGRHPMSALAAAGGARPRVVLVVDQLEEVVSLCADDDERRAFIDTLVDHVEADGDLVVALRADRLGAVSDAPSMARLIERGLLLLGGMSDADLRSAIEGPARQAGLLLEPGLVDVLVLEVAREPGALPMLSHALVQTWERREGRTLTVEGYRASGGVQRAVGQTAEEVFLGLDESAQRIARDMVLRLVVPGGTNEPSRCRVAHRIIAPDAEHERIVDRLVAARLITSDGESVELAHESLARAWPRLRAWLDDDTEGLLILRHLTMAADSWQSMGRPASELYRGVRLQQALQWRRSNDPDLSETERAFLDAGEALARAESQVAEERARREHRTNRRLRRLLAGTVALLLVATATGGIALRESRRADDQARLAQVRELAAEAHAARAEDPQLALLLALEATSPELAGGEDVAPEAVEALHAAVVSSRLAYIGEDGGGSVAWSADGELIATEGPEDSGLVDVRDAATGEPVIRFPGHDIDVNDVAFGATGLLATAGDDGAVRVWDVDRREPVLELTGPGEAWHPTFSADGRRVAAAWRDPGLIRVAEVDDPGGEVRSAIALGGYIFDAALSPDGASVAVGMPGRASVVVDVDDAQVRREIRGHEAPVTAVSYSPDGRWLASGDASGLVRISDAGSGQVTHTLSDASTEIARLAWDEAAGLLATGSWDGTVRVYDVTDQGAQRTTAVRDPETVGGVVGLAFSPDGARIAAGDFVATSFVVWDIGPHGNAEVHNVVSSPAGSAGVAFGPSGLLYTVAVDGSVEVWDESGEQVRVLERPGAQEGPASFGSLVLSADEDLVGVGSSGEGVHVWDVESGEMLLADTERAGDWRPALAPDGQTIAVAADRAVIVYGADGRQQAVLTSHGGAVPTRPVFSPDGTTVALIEERARNTQIARTVVLWEWTLGTTREIDIGTGNDIAFAPDGTRIAVADLESKSRIVDVQTGEVVLTLDVSSNVAAVTYSPLGDVIATGGLDGTASLWDAASGAEVMRLPSTGGAVDAVSFSPDGRRLATSSMAGDIVRVWTLDPHELRQIAAAEVVRELTEVECLRFLHRPCEG
jgi:WD40 repeat protein/DNA-binding SARP family transcriptional activator/energy-coupling factor transporter ATP-binding protein EcfA2